MNWETFLDALSQSQLRRDLTYNIANLYIVQSQYGISYDQTKNIQDTIQWFPKPVEYVKWHDTPWSTTPRPTETTQRIPLPTATSLSLLSDNVAALMPSSTTNLCMWWCGVSLISPMLSNALHTILQFPERSPSNAQTGCNIPTQVSSLAHNVSTHTTAQTATPVKWLWNGYFCIHVYQ